MRSPRRQRGEGKAGCIFWGLIFLIGGMVGFQFVPAKIADMQFKDHMDELAKLRPRGTKEEFERSVFARADELAIDLDKQNVQISKTLQRVRFRVKYTVELDIIVTSIPYTFDHDIQRDIFLVN